MNDFTIYHQLGKFIVRFQWAESGVSGIMLLLAKGDDEMINILINELEYSKRLKTADVLFARFLDVRKGDFDEEKKNFHKLISTLSNLGERRNDLVHSKFVPWRNIEGQEGLLRRNSKLRGSKGIREKSEEELLAENFEDDFKKLDAALNQLENFRMKIINWLYPDE